MKCRRTACQKLISLCKYYYLIWNGIEGNEPSSYCNGCGRQITKHNPDMMFERVSN